MVNTFLHGRDRGHDVDDCIGLVTSAGLAFPGWFSNARDCPHDWFLPGTAAYDAVNRAIFYMACRPIGRKTATPLTFGSGGSTLSR